VKCATFCLVTNSLKNYASVVSNGRTTRLIAEVKLWCKANNIKQIELAAMLGVSTQLITEWFKGRRFPVSEQALHLQEIIKRKPKPRKPKP
jgi:DNA-binding transcriptional regulator YiaG